MPVARVHGSIHQPHVKRCASRSRATILPVLFTSSLVTSVGLGAFSGAVGDRVAALAAGLGLQMPGGDDEPEVRIVEAVESGDRTRVQWRCLPHDFPPWETELAPL